MLPVILVSALSAIDIVSVAPKGSDDVCDTEDWVKLQNTGATEQSLQGYVLYDDKGEGNGYVFGDVSIAPGEILLLCKDGTFTFGIGSEDTITLSDGASIIDQVSLAGQSATNLVYSKTNGQWGVR